MAVRFCIAAIAVALLSGGCRTAGRVRDPEFCRVSQAMDRAWCRPAPPVDPLPPAAPRLAGPQPVEVYILAALQRNPEIHAARKRMEALAHQVPVAASLQDPLLNVAVQPEPVQTAAGQQELSVTASQKLHWFGKLDTRAGVAEAETNVARAKLAAVELATIAQVKRAYYELYFVQQAIAVTEEEQKLLADIRDVANSRYKSGQTSQQDVLRAELEISNTENELIQLRQRLQTAQARLARTMHIAPSADLLAAERLPAEQAPRDLELLQRQAVAARPELHAELAALRRDRRAVELARLEYKPDVTLGLSWIDTASAGISPVANGRDAFLLSAGVNLPVYRKRLDSSVRSAEAYAVSTARSYDSIRDATVEEVTDLFARARSQQEMLTLFREDILPKSRQTLQVSSRGYNVGEVDFLQLIDNWRQLLRYAVMNRRLEADLRQTLAELERTVGGFAPLAAASSAMAPQVESVLTPPPAQ